MSEHREKPKRAASRKPHASPGPDPNLEHTPVPDDSEELIDLHTLATAEHGASASHKRGDIPPSRGPGDVPATIKYDVHAAELLDPEMGLPAALDESSAVISSPGSAIKKPGGTGTVPDAIFPLTTDEVLAEADDDDAFSMLAPSEHDSTDALNAPPSSAKLNSAIWREGGGSAPVADGPLQSSAVNLLAPGPNPDPSGTSGSALSTDDPEAGPAGPSSHIFGSGGPDSAVELVPAGDDVTTPDLSGHMPLPPMPVRATPGETSGSVSMAQPSGMAEDDQLSFTRPARSRHGRRDDDSSASILDEVNAATEVDNSQQLPSLSRVRDQSEPARPAGGRRRLLGWLGAGLVGAAATAGLGAGAWYFELLPSRTPAKPNIEPAALAQGRAKAGMDKLASGQLIDALRDLDAAVLADPQSAPALVGRGRGRWLMYQLDCARANKKPAANNQVVTQVRKDFQEAAAKDYRAYLWLGVTEEDLGNRKGAAKAYQDGIEAFPSYKKLFQAALDRLEAQRPDAPGGSGALVPTEEELLLAMVGLFFQNADEDARAGDEPGFDFWSAVRAAQRQEYGAARALLLKARQAHERRRTFHVSHGLNPTSDPREEIFVRCCDELRAYWDLRQKLQDAGIDTPARGSAAPALAHVLSDRQQFDGQLTDARARADAATRERDAARKELTDKQAAAAVAKQEVEQARSDAAQARATAGALEKDRDASAAAKKDAEERAKQAAAKLATAETTLDRAAQALKAAGRLDAQAGRDAVPEAVARLAAALTAPAAPTNDAGSSRRLTEVQSELDRVRQQLADARAEAARRPAASTTTALGAPVTIPVSASSPAEAARQYEAGLSAYHGGRLENAEVHFGEAVRHNGRDARYLYYLGLTRYRQGRVQAAIGDFQTAAELERQGLPGPRDVNLSLERVQGALRAAVTPFRP